MQHCYYFLRTDLSSARGELQSQTAMTIITKSLLQAHNANNISITMLGDNKGVQHICQHTHINRLKHHRDPNIDLLLEYTAARNDIQIKSEWIHGHQDKDMEWSSIEELTNLPLSNSAIMNVWCDYKAEMARHTHFSHPDAEVLPNEKWAIFSSSPILRKITGALDYNILCTMHGESMEHYIHQKHDICAAKLKDLNTNGLHCYMKRCKSHKRANIAKLIHRWIPTNAFLHQQDRAISPVCPQCLDHHETAEHILTCPNHNAQESRSNHLYKMLQELEKISTSTYILATIETKLTQTLDIQNKKVYTFMDPTVDVYHYHKKTVQHQNLIG
jgi:hypothetical protein